MNLFWLEYLHFIVSVFAILVSVSAATLFFITYRSEQKLTSVWRAIGFISLAVAFFLYILERKYPGVGILGIVVELFGLYGILKGMTADLNLSMLRKTPAIGSVKRKKKKGKKAKEQDQKGLFRTLIAIIVFGLIFIATYFLFEAYLPAAAMTFTLVFILGTIRLQIRRFRSEGKDRATRLQNLWPLLGYIFLLYRAIALIFYRLPETDIIVLRQLAVDYSLAWQISILCGFLGFLGLGIWAWTYIKVRAFLRTYVTFLTIAIIVSSLGSLVFTLLIFQIVEDNNLELMQRGAQTEHVIAQDKQDTALFVARTIATNPSVINQIQTHETDGILASTQEQQENANLDYIRVYNGHGEVVASPVDPQMVGEMLSSDPLVRYVTTQRSHIKSFEIKDTELGPILIARAVHPIVSNGTVVGAIEAGYYLDNAFVDYSKNKTGLDVTIYSDDERSATTILQEDGITRWVGSREQENDVLSKVLEKGEKLSLVVDRLGVVYYAGYVPIRDYEGEVIGMVSVGTPTVVLFEDTRQELVSTFLIVTVISLLAAGLGYGAMRSFRKVKAA